MPKFTFTCEHEHVFTGKSLSKITVESNRDRLDHVLEDIEDFLLGCGYVIDGDIGVIEDVPTATSAAEALELFPEVHYWYNEFLKNNTINCSFSSMCDTIPNNITSDTITITTGTV